MIKQIVICLSLMLSISVSLASASDSARPDLHQAIESLDHGIKLLEQNDPDAQQAIELAATQIEYAIREYGYHSAAAYHALGNAYTLTGDMGHAMLAYRRAELIDPRDIRVQDSIDYVRDQVHISVEPNIPNRIRAALISWRGIVPRTWIWAAGITLFVFAWGVFTIGLFSAQSRRARTVGIALLVSSLFPFTALGYEWSHEHARAAVVVVHDEIVAMSGPDDSIYDAVYSDPLQSGVEAHLIETRDGWGRVQLIDGSMCWIPQSAFERVIPESAIE